MLRVLGATRTRSSGPYTTILCCTVGPYPKGCRPYMNNEFIEEYNFGVVPQEARIALRSTLITPAQIRRFELLRLAFFVLKLRKLEQRTDTEGAEAMADEEYEWRCNLLRHAIFQQVVTLSKLDARQQAMQLIATCRK